jgi:hypothetical protein
MADMLFRLIPPTLIAIGFAVCLALPKSTFAEESPALTFNEDGVLLIGDRKVFPVGFTLPPPPQGKAPDGRHAYKALADAGATFIRTGPMGPGGAWNDEWLKNEQAYQDAAAANGLRCLPWLKELASVGPKEAKKEARLRAVISRFKDHPGMGLWKGADEPEWGKLPVAPLERAYQIVHELDPRHPVWIVQAPRGTVEALKAYDPTYDVVGLDIYPISYPPGTHSLLPNKEISMVGDYTRQMREVAAAGGKPKPVWMTLQIAWSGVSKPGKTLRMPTFAEERFMTYQAIINGARGLVYFGGHVPEAWSERDRGLGWNWTFWQRVLGPVIEEVGTKGPLAAALVAPESKLAVKVEGAEGVEFVVRETADAVFLLACKREGKTARATFSGLPTALADGEVMFESPRRVRAEGGAFVDWFAPFDVHVYRFAR